MMRDGLGYDPRGSGIIRDDRRGSGTSSKPRDVSQLKVHLVLTRLRWRVLNLDCDNSHSLNSATLRICLSNVNS